MSVHPIRDTPPDATVPPHDLEAEEAVLGACLLSAKALTTAQEILAPQDFYKPAHAETFDAMLALYASGGVVDAVTVGAALGQSLEALGGKTGLFALIASVPSPGAVMHYARIVASQAVLRRLMDAGQQITDLAAASDDPPAAVLAAEGLVYGAGERAIPTPPVVIGDSLDGAMKAIQALHDSGRAVTGVPTGLVDLDEALGGLHSGNLVVVGARPGMGKSAWALVVARHAAAVEGKPALFFSMEMSRDELMMRLLSQEGRIDGQRLRGGSLADTDWPRLSEALARLSDVPLWIDDTPAISVPELRAKCRRFTADGLGLVVVDYLQLVRGAKGGDNRVQEVGGIARDLKILAGDMGCPVVALSQLSRNVEYRADKRPMLADLRESGDIEAHANAVIGLYRDEAYNADSAEKGVAELLILKNRSGPCTTVKILWTDSTTRFDNLASRRYEQGTMR